MPRVRKREIARPSRLKLLWRRQRRLVRPLFMLGAGFAAVLFAVTLVHSAEPGGAVAGLAAALGRALDLRVDAIEVTGRANTPQALLDAALGVHRGDPILGFSVAGARQRIESLSWVQHVAVERRLPDTITVVIQERRPFAIWQNQGRFQLIDRAGQIVTDEDVTAFGDLPLVVGAGAPAEAAKLLDALAAYPVIRDRLAAAIRVGNRRWNLQLKRGLVVMLPETEEDAALRRLNDLQSQQALLDRPLVFVDLRLADRLAVRVRPGAEAPAAAPADPHVSENPNRRAT